MAPVTLTASVRDMTQSAKNLRKQGFVPAEFYGHGIENMTLQVNYGDFRRLYRTAGTNTVIEMDVEGKGKKNVLVQRLDTHPVTGEIAYVEFINVRMDEEVTAMIPVRLDGQAPAVRELGAMLVQNLDELEVTCLPAYLPKEIVVNIDSLVDLSAKLHVSDIVAPERVKIVTDPEEMVASVTMPQEEEVAEAAPVVDMATAVEVTTEKKTEEGAGEYKD